MRPTWRAGGLFSAGLALAVVAAGLGSLALARFAALLLALPLVGLCWVVITAVATRPVRLSRTVRPLRPEAGGQAQVHLAVGAGALAPWAQLRERAPAAMNRSAPQPVIGEGRRWSYLIEPRLRGRYTLGPSTIIYGDPLRLLRWSRRGDDAEQILVWPRTADITHVLRPGELHAARPGRSGTPQRSVEDLTLREYRSGDDVHRVHWRSSARRGQLMVRADEPVTPPAIDLILDLGPAASQRHTEWAVSAAASAGRSLCQDQMPIRLHTARLDTGPRADATTTTPLHATHPAQILDALALARPLPELTEAERRALADAHRREADRMGPTVLAILSTPSARALADLAPLARSRRCYALIVAPHSEHHRPGQELRDTGWIVHHLDPGPGEGTSEIPAAFLALFDQSRSGAEVGR
ncbi:MAG TPA: DUF58 domain-containing protein [Beutenbergiaceae bacterium]|nr:DUF58 domain-containing protein [Beutenbergiaceae bacterium]